MSHQHTASVPMGTIVAFGLSAKSIPENWFLCDGNAIPQQYQEFITLFGGNTPNLAGRILLGTGKPVNGKQSDGTVPNFGPITFPLTGATGGEWTHQLTIPEIPKHSHQLANAYHGGATMPNATNWDRRDFANWDNGTLETGGDQPHNNVQPYFTVNYIVYAGLPE